MNIKKAFVGVVISAIGVASIIIAKNGYYCSKLSLNPFCESYNNISEMPNISIPAQGINSTITAHIHSEDEVLEQGQGEQELHTTTIASLQNPTAQAMPNSIREQEDQEFLAAIAASLQEPTAQSTLIFLEERYEKQVKQTKIDSLITKEEQEILKNKNLDIELDESNTIDPDIISSQKKYKATINEKEVDVKDLISSTNESNNFEVSENNESEDDKEDLNDILSDHLSESKVFKYAVPHKLSSEESDNSPQEKNLSREEVVRLRLAALQKNNKE